jgi:hypothetical protein
MSLSPPSSAAQGAAGQHTPDVNRGPSLFGSQDGKKPLVPDVLLTHVLKVSTPARNNNQVNLPFLVNELLIRINHHCPGTRILPKQSHKNKHLPLVSANDVPCNEDIEIYATDLQYDAKHQQHHVFIEIDTKFTFNDVKYGSTRFLNFLKDKKIWIVRHGHSSRQAMSIGHINFLHPSYGSRDSVTNILKQHLDGIEFILAPTKQYFWKNEKRTNVEVVEVVVGPLDVDHTRALALNIFSKAKQYGLGEMEFIPLIQNGFDVETYRNALQAHYEWCQNILSVSIEGLKFPDKTFHHGGVENSFTQIVQMLTDDDGQTLFSGVERTKDTKTKGRYLLLTTRDKIKAAQKELDNFFDYLTQHGKHRDIGVEGIEIRRTNNTFTAEEVTHADILQRKYGKQQPDTTPRRRNRNPWLSRKRSPEVVLTVDDDTEFPHILATPAEKRIRPTTHMTESPDDATNVTSTTGSSEYMDQIRQLERKFVADAAKAKEERRKELNNIADMKKAIENGNKQVIRIFEENVTSIRATSNAAMERSIQNEKTMVEMQTCITQLARVVVQLAPMQGREETFASERDKLKELIMKTGQTKRSHDEVSDTKMDWNDYESEEDDFDLYDDAAGTEEGASRTS